MNSLYCVYSAAAAAAAKALILVGRPQRPERPGTPWSGRWCSALHVIGAEYMNTCLPRCCTECFSTRSP